MHITLISNTNTNRFNVTRATAPQNKSQNFVKFQPSFSGFSLRVKIYMAFMGVAALTGGLHQYSKMNEKPLPKASTVATKDSLALEHLRALAKTKYREADSLSIAIDNLIRHKK